MGLFPFSKNENKSLGLLLWICRLILTSGLSLVVYAAVNELRAIYRWLASPIVIQKGEDTYTYNYSYSFELISPFGEYIGAGILMVTIACFLALRIYEVSARV